jgi:nucleotide sugar dehydrogenase
VKIGIIGGGVVGHATARSWTEHADVRVYDINPKKRTHSLPDALVGDVVFICLPTPLGDNKRLDTSVIEQFCQDHQGYGTNFVLRSTVPIGFTRQMREKYDLQNLVHNPEFLTARCAVLDANMPAQLVIGVPYPKSHYVWSLTDDDTRVGAEPLQSIYERRFPGIPIRVIHSDESEAAKLFLNSFFAVKVAFANELRTLSDYLGLDWEYVREVLLGDGRLCSSHTQVPGPDGKRGFGGTCLPKDLSELVGTIRDAGQGYYIGSATLARNSIDRKEAPSCQESTTPES